MKVLFLGLAYFFVACAPKVSPNFKGQIFTLDNRKKEDVLLRYKGDRRILHVTDPEVMGSQCFLPEDFIQFLDVYIVKP